MTAAINIMFDLETWGTKPGCDIRSIGACVFDPLTGMVPHRTDPTKCFQAVVDNPTREVAGYADGTGDRRQYNLTRDPDTVKWWSEQSKEAQAQFASPMHLLQGLQLFSKWIGRQFNSDEGTQAELHLWSHGPHFDVSILTAVYDAVGAGAPWSYRSPRDTRTIMTAAGMDPHHGLTPFACGTHHNALDDSLTQARAVCEAYRRLGLVDPALNRSAMIEAAMSVDIIDTEQGDTPLRRDEAVAVVDAILSAVRPHPFSELKASLRQRDDLLEANNRYQTGLREYRNKYDACCTRLVEEVPGVPEEDRFFIWHNHRKVWNGSTKEAGESYAKANNITIDEFEPFEP